MSLDYCIYASSYFTVALPAAYMCPHTTIYVSSYYCIYLSAYFTVALPAACVIILLYVTPTLASRSTNAASLSC
jgi:hypothetical protein